MKKTKKAVRRPKGIVRKKQKKKPLKTIIKNKGRQKSKGSKASKVRKLIALSKKKSKKKKTKKK